MSDELDARLRAAAPALVAALPDGDLDRYLAHGRRLIQRTHWEAARGFIVTEAMIDSIAAHAAVLVAGFQPRTEPFRDTTSVIVHAGTIVSRDVVQGPTRGVVSNGPRYLAGQAGHGRGPIVLDWRTASREVAHPERGVNVIYHEFAHKLDGLDGVFDGMPPLGSGEARAQWEQTIGTNYRRLKRRGSDRLVRAYGATNQAEYFAVTTELFFTVPVSLRAEHPRVYDRLAEFYRQDPAARALSSSRTSDT
jgi:Mlc titration factor MtfA (ptsG expression regulator)